VEFPAEAPKSVPAGESPAQAAAAKEAPVQAAAAGD
jgi:hypothetical protein